MLLIHYNAQGAKRVVDLQDMLRGGTAMLVGGAPSLKEQPVELLSQRGVTTMAMNNAGLHFRPTMWASGDHPECYEPRLLLDPTIMKFAPVSYAETTVLGRKYRQMPNIWFYIPEANVPWDEYLAARRGVPWYNNTLFVSIHVLYMLGVRTIILAGSDFGFGLDGSMYAHATHLGDLEKKWNLDLYNSLVRELRMLRPMFERAGLTLMDCSKNSRIAQTYKHLTMEEAVKYCTREFPEHNVDPGCLPHCSKFAPRSIQDSIAQWPGYRMVGSENDGTALTPVL
jgi:hypothetical protein